MLADIEPMNTEEGFKGQRCAILITNPQSQTDTSPRLTIFCADSIAPDEARPACRTVRQDCGPVRRRIQ
jgi:hypothetical protein